MRKINKSGGGANTNKNGLWFEQATSLNHSLLQNGFTILGSEVYFDNCFVGWSVPQNQIYSQFLRPQGIHYQNYNSKGWRPDECFINKQNQTVYIVEKKFQNSSGSVDEKLASCHFKLLEYKKLFEPLSYKVEFIYIFNDWFKQDQYKDVLEYIREGLPLKHFLLLTFHKDLKEFIVHLSEIIVEEEEKGFVAISQLKGKPYKDLQLSEKKEFWLTHFSQMRLSQFLQKYHRNIFLVAEKTTFTVTLSQVKDSQEEEMLIKTLEILAETNQLDETKLFVYEKNNRFELEEELTSNNSQHANLISEAIAGEKIFVVVKRKPFFPKEFQNKFDSDLKLKEYFDYLNRH